MSPYALMTSASVAFVFSCCLSLCLVLFQVHIEPIPPNLANLANLASVMRRLEFGGHCDLPSVLLFRTSREFH